MALHGQASPYICDLLKPELSALQVKTSLYTETAFNLKAYGGRSFLISAPTPAVELMADHYQQL